MPPQHEHVTTRITTQLEYALLTSTNEMPDGSTNPYDWLETLATFLETKHAQRYTASDGK